MITSPKLSFLIRPYVISMRLSPASIAKLLPALENYYLTSPIFPNLRYVQHKHPERPQKITDLKLQLSKGRCKLGMQKKRKLGVLT